MSDRPGLPLALLAAVVLLAPGAAAQEPTLLEAVRAQGRLRRVIRPDYPVFASLGERYVVSDAVVRGRVVNQRARLSDDGRTVWTDYTIEVLAALKPAENAPAAGSTLVVPVEGGNLVVEGRPISVVNELFAPLPWVREHLFFLRRPSAPGEPYQLLDGPRSLFRRNDQGLMRCHLTKPDWDYFCRAYNGTPWGELLRELQRKR